MTGQFHAERSNLDFVGFAQEFLRRNPAYRAAWLAMERRAAIERPTVAQEMMAQPWGLAFPMRA
mgnify:CR=1 FL=1